MEVQGPELLRSGPPFVSDDERPPTHPPFSSIRDQGGGGPGGFVFYSGNRSDYGPSLHPYRT